jgi:hypothetical protein
MADFSAIVSAASAAGALVCSVAVTVLTRRISAATLDTRDAAKAQARSAQATTLVQLGPVIASRIDRFIEDHRTALEKVERLIVDSQDLVRALILAETGVSTTLNDFEQVRVNGLDVGEIVPERVDGTTRGPKVLSVSLSVKPLSADLQRLLHRKDGYDSTDLRVPRWGTGLTFIIDERLVRDIYGALWPAIHDANEINLNAFYYDARDLLQEYISNDWRASFVFALALTGYRNPTQYRLGKLAGRMIVGRGEDGRFSAIKVVDPGSLPQLNYTSNSVVA